MATVSPAGGTLAQGASTSRDGHDQRSRGSLAAGAYSSTVSFGNSTNGVGSTSARSA